MTEYLPPRRPFLDGIRSTAPVQLGSFPFAFVCGVTAYTSGLDFWSATGMSVIMFAGASQLVALQLLTQGTPVAVVILSACIVNLRFFMYSATLAPHYKTLALPWKLLFAATMTDQGFAVTMTRFGPSWTPEQKRWFAFGSGLVMWVSWQVAALLGFVVGSGIPSEWSLEFAVPLTFLALTVPALRDRPLVAAFIVAGAVGVAGHALPLNLGLMTAAAAGIVTGLIVEARQR